MPIKYSRFLEQNEIQHYDIQGKILFDRIVFEARNYLDLSSENTIAKEFPGALGKATSKIAKDKNVARSIRLIISQQSKIFGM